LAFVNYDLLVSELVDPADLIDAGVVAELLGLSSRKAVSVYRSRYPDFPAPRVERGERIVLWLRQDVEAWAETRARS
jgi:predicted DNA-binding transcriptional regulator AlpA